MARSLRAEPGCGPTALHWLVASCLALTVACRTAKEGVEKKPKETILELKNEQAPSPGKPLELGDTVYDFTALVHTGQKIRLSDYTGKPVLVYFCSQDRAQVCSELAQDLRDHWLALNTHVGMVIAVSLDDTVQHRDFASTHELPFLLAADNEGAVHRIFGVAPGLVTGYLIDQERKVIAVLTPRSARGYAQEVSAALARLGLLKPVPPP